MGKKRGERERETKWVIQNTKRRPAEKRSNEQPKRIT